MGDILARKQQSRGWALSSNMSGQESLNVRKVVVNNDFVELYKIVVEHGVRVLNDLHAMDGQGYYNGGTPMHWAVWDRHWDIITFCASCGANFNVKGQGSWMNNRTVAEYAR